MESNPLHLRPAAPIAPDALLPGDPGRALAIAEAVLVKPRMSNHARGLWGYYGETKAEGRPLTVQATGIGGPSAAIVLEELHGLGVRRAIRVGTCGALDPSLELGDLLVAEAAISADGTSAKLGAGELAEADPKLSAALLGEGVPGVRVASSDLFYDPALEANTRAWVEAGASALEMEAATLFALGRRLKIAVACLLTVSDINLTSGPASRARIDPEPLAASGVRMGQLASSALARG